MKRRMILATVVMATLLVSVIGFSASVGERSASADSSPLTYDFLVSPGRDLINPDCDQGDPDTAFALCPDRATAQNGDVIDIKGSGTLSLHSKSATGRGEFVHYFAGGGSMSGTWTATELLSFKTYGPSPILDPTWRTGMAHIRVHLVSDDGTVEADAILSLGCKLPQVSTPGGVYEGVRLKVLGGLNFNMETDPRATLFILTSGDDGF